MARWPKICLVAVVLLGILPFANIHGPFPGYIDLKAHYANAFSKGDRVKVSESVTVVVNGRAYSAQNASDDSKIGEFVKLSTVVVKENTNSVTTMNSIFNAERLRFNGKALVRYDQMADSQAGTISDLGSSTTVPDTGGEKNPDSGSMVYNALPALLSNSNNSPTITGPGNMNNSSLKPIPGTSYEKYSLILVFIPIFGSVIIYYGYNGKKSKSFFSIIFMIIISSSVVTTPLSLSGIYVRQAFAEDETKGNLSTSGFSNSTEINLSNFSNSTQPIGVDGFSNATQTLDLGNFSNSTQPLNFAGFAN
ncbi:MAG: hypothetical protein KGJ07_09035, partial [Patescibacteria group bacterium]|nr:hypothetical protein [Patescibacteria group bacterium]